MRAENMFATIGEGGPAQDRSDNDRTASSLLGPGVGGSCPDVESVVVVVPLSRTTLGCPAGDMDMSVDFVPLLEVSHATLGCREAVCPATLVNGAASPGADGVRLGGGLGTAPDCRGTVERRGNGGVVVAVRGVL